MPQTNSANRVRKHLETVINLALILTFLALIGIVGKLYIFSDSKTKSIEVGDRISLPGVAWGDAKEKNLLLFLQSDCKFSSDGMGFYLSLVKNTAQNPQTRIIAVFSKDDNGYREYLKAFGLEGLETQTINFRELGIAGAPTLLLLDSDGSVKNIWKGFLSPKQENEVRKLFGLPVIDFYIEEPELRSLLKSGKKLTVVDTRSRDEYEKNHFEYSINIPDDELFVRAINELPASVAIAVYGKSTYDGELAQKILSQQGFREVYILRFTSN